ncbi:MAG: hypothetical protein ACOCZH_00525 [Phototrophicaceae bacterium]
MHTEAYENWTHQLVASAQADPDVVGLVALGSMANAARRDNWSDHDFFVITRPGRQEHYRQTLTWLPDHARIVLHFRETAHGLKVMYDDAHLLEFAVFDPEELSVARANDYVVLLDRAGIAAHMQAIAAPRAEPVDPGRQCRFVLTLIQVGSGRYARGERLSGHVFIKSYALDHLLRLLIALHAPAGNPVLDNLDPFRRVERAFPALAAEISALLLRDPLACAAAYLDLIAREARPVLGEDFPAAAWTALQAHLQRIHDDIGEG